MMKIATIVLLLAATVYATPFSPCTGITPPISVDVVGCTAEPCQFKRGTTIVANGKFKAVKTTKLTANLKATSNGATIDFPLPETNACLSLTGAKCPLAGGETPTYKLSVPIPASYPKVSTVLELHLVGDNNVQVTCAKLKAVIVD